MALERNIGILGDGRIARAVASFLGRLGGYRARAIARDRDAAECDALIAALPGELGERGLRLALRYGKNLVDISDVDPPYYARRRKEISAAGIIVVPGCGFSPGLVNGILGHELRSLGSARSIEIKAGSLSRREQFYPFLWCFEDLVLEHRIPSWQLVDGKKRKFPPFAGYQRETFFGIEAESYYCASGFENILDKFKARSIVTRVVRPRGFYEFFSFMRNYGFFEPRRMAAAKAALESVSADNTTFAAISFTSGGSRVQWLAQSSSSARERLNSMQKITAALPVVMARAICEGALPSRGLIFMEDIGARAGLLTRFIREIRAMGVTVRRACRKATGDD